jgi:DNA-binding HxlR family transcriptional regulator
VVTSPGRDRCTLRSACPIAGALDILGDRWTLLVLRDVLFLGRSTFQEFLASPERISSNTLAERLRRLERHRIVRKQAYAQRPTRWRYLPTTRGCELMPLLSAAARWGLRHVEGTKMPSAAQLRALRAGSPPSSPRTNPGGAP